MTSFKGILFVLSAPTGGGKTTVARATLEKLENRYKINKVITYTTRLPRRGEVNESDYHFVTEEDFLHKKEHDFFLETTFYDGHWYGSPRGLINDLDQGKSFIIITDLPGAHIIKQKLPEAVLIWLTIANISTIADRLHQRGAANDAELERRIAIAEREIEQEQKEHFFDYHIANMNLDVTVDKCASIIEHKLGQRQN